MRTCIFNDGEKTEKESRSDRYCERKQQNGGIDRDFVESRQTVRADVYEQPKSRVCDADAEHAAQNAKEQTFKEKFAGNLLAICAERGSNRELLLTSFSADKKQIGHIGARDEQHDRDRPH